MHTAAVEQFLKAISRLQKHSPHGASLAALAQATHVSTEQAGQTVRSLVERGLVEVGVAGAICLTPYGLRRLLTESIEDYLVTIYRLSRGQEGERVTTSAIAQALSVSAPSVTGMIQKKLAGLGLVDYERHRGVTLTPLGERVALQILRHHRVVELYLTETLGLPWDQVHDEAHRLEHAASPALIERMAATLGDPLVDPHGDPIPRQDGTVVHAGLTPLYETAPGQTVVVRRIRDQSSEVLRYLGEIGLVPGTAVEVLARAPLGGPLMVRIGGTSQALGRDLAQAVLVAPPPGAS
jgi:DtxR family Mn-dependent transcriptional regulator